MRPLTTAKDVLGALRTYYRDLYRSSSLAPADWTLLAEVRLSAHRNEQDADSRVDALAVRIRGGSPYLVANEIKVERRDLESELANGAKREPWQRIVNAFDLVTPVGLTSAEEIEFSAPDLGLLEYDPETGEVVRRRSGFETKQIPPPSWDLVVAMLRAGA